MEAFDSDSEKPKNTAEMTDRRGYFRLQDRVTLDYEKFAEGCNEIDPYSNEFSVSPQLKLLNELHKLESDSRHLLHPIMEQNRQVGQYLKSMSKRISYISNFITTASNGTPPHPTHDISLSEGGVAFDAEENLSLGQLIHLKLVLFPSLTHIAAIGKVSYSKQHSSVAGIATFRIGIEFEHITDPDRGQIAKHIMQEQSRMRRKQQTLSSK
ncbi:MAG: PilZ domain-containing protein [Pseudomonadales bacterium]|nr:PilZ domain-containing protein [Pseudomonadales bacterium]